MELLVYFLSESMINVEIFIRICIDLLLDMTSLTTGKMIYRNFGNSGLKVSALSMGNMINVREETY